MDKDYTDGKAPTCLEDIPEPKPPTWSPQEIRDMKMRHNFSGIVQAIETLNDGRQRYAPTTLFYCLKRDCHEHWADQCGCSLKVMIIDEDGKCKYYLPKQKKP